MLSILVLVFEVLVFYVFDVSARCTAQPFVSGLIASPSAASSFCSKHLASSQLSASDYPPFAKSCSIWPTRVSFACAAYITDPPALPDVVIHKKRLIDVPKCNMRSFISGLRASPVQASVFCESVVTANRYVLPIESYPAFAAPCRTWSTRIGFACLVQQSCTGACLGIGATPTSTITNPATSTNSVADITTSTTTTSLQSLSSTSEDIISTSSSLTTTSSTTHLSSSLSTLTTTENTSISSASSTTTSSDHFSTSSTETLSSSLTLPTTTFIDSTSTLTTTSFSDSSAATTTTESFSLSLTPLDSTSLDSSSTLITTVSSDSSSTFTTTETSYSSLTTTLLTTTTSSSSFFANSSESSTTASPFITSTNSLNLTTSTSSSTSATACAATDNAVIAAGNSDIDKTSYLNLFLTNTAVLNYADPPPGKTAVSIQIRTTYQQVMFENSAFLTQVVCRGNSISVLVTDEFAYRLATAWPQTDFVIITNTNGCNTPTKRGVYLVTSHTSDASSSTITFDVVEKAWEDVSETMTISYGAVGSDNGSNKAVYSSSCSNTLSSTTSTTTSAGSEATSLSPAAKAMIDYILSKASYDPDSNTLVVSTAPDPVEIEAGDNPVIDSALLAKLKDMMREDGLPDPDALFEEAKNATSAGEAGETCTPATKGTPHLCPNVKRRSLAYGNGRNTKRNYTMPELSLDLVPRNLRHDLAVRDATSDEVFEYICDDFVEFLLGPFEILSNLHELLCGLYKLYKVGEVLYEAGRQAVDSGMRQLIEVVKCMLNPFCFNPPEVRVTITYPPATRWKYTYGWRVSWSGLNGYYLLYGGNGNYVKCVDCGFSISDVTIDGQITYNVSDRSVTEAHNNLRVSSVARMVMDLETKGAWSGKGTAIQTSASLGDIRIDSMFTFSPTIIFNLGVEASANAPISVKGGAVLTFNSASVDLDYIDKVSSNERNWQPSIEMTYPGFQNDAKVNFSPIMMTDVRITMNIFNGAFNKYSAVTTQLTVGFEGTYSETNTATCAANQLSLKSYVKYQSDASFNGETPRNLQKDTSNNPGRCFNVPRYFPTAEEISSLRQEGGEFCTSFINYHAPVSTIVTQATVSLNSITSSTTTSTYTTTDTTTVVETATSSSYILATQYSFVWNTEYVGDGKDSVPTSDSCKSKRSTPASKDLNRRDAVPTPTLVSTWANDKISYACSQIATGTLTTTLYTSTSTTYTGVSTSTITATRTVGVGGPMITRTETKTRYIVTSLTHIESRLYEPTTVTTSCPVQTQIPCFRIKGHGPPSIDGQYLGSGVYSGRGFTAFGANTFEEDGIFSLDDNGILYSRMRRVPMSYIQLPENLDYQPYIDYVESAFPGEALLAGGEYDYYFQYDLGYFYPSGTELKFASCAIDCQTSVLTCTGPKGLNQLYVFDPTGQVADRNYVQGYPNWYPEGLTDFPFRPMWEPPTELGDWALSPVHFTVEEVTCPCRY